MTKQKDKVLEYMRAHGSISAMEAFSALHITRLSARIYDLRRDGHEIVSERVSRVNKEGRRVSYERFYINGKG